jgi:glycosyltransferase involved in cell wall biosynthesis
LVERSLKTVDALLAPSRFTADRHREAGLTVPIHVLPLFSDLGPQVSIETSVTARPYFLYVGRVTASKGITVLLKDFLSIHQYDLVIVGDGDLRVSLQRQYAQSPHIRFLGPLSHHELAPLYQQATALILPSLAPESFGLSVIESFACGTPAIVHHAGGSRETVDTTGGGYVYESPQGFHQALFLLAEDMQLRETLGQRARTGYEQYYSQKRYVGRYLDLVKEIAKKKNVTFH